MFDLACVINGRNLGDAVIQSRSVRNLLDNGFARQVLIWTRPESVDAYRNVPEVEVVTSPFPVGTNRAFRMAALSEFLAAAKKIRRRRIQVSLDFFGDLRERLFARVLASPLHLGIAWAPGHPYRQTLRLPMSPRSAAAAVISPEIISVYEAHATFVNSLTGQEGIERSTTAPQRRAPREPQIVGLHPFASQECKLWPERNWLDLCVRLLSTGKEVRVFGSGTDRPQIERIFQSVLSRVSVLTVSLAAFLQEVGKLDLMIGLDSLGVHAADRAGVPSIMLAGSNHRRMWAPPLSVSIGQSGGCSFYPCYNKPRCTGKSGEYVCIRSVSVDQVLTALAPGPA
jgi:heptosyltransferase-3